MQYELLIEPEVHEARKRLPGHVRQQVKRAAGDLSVRFPSETRPFAERKLEL